jgi:hypothetical protein
MIIILLNLISLITIKTQKEDGSPAVLKLRQIFQIWDFTSFVIFFEATLPAKILKNLMRNMLQAMQ